jgi:glucokinase
MTYLMGLDIGGTKCAVILGMLDGNLEILDFESFPTPDTYKEGLALLEERMEILRKKHALDWSDIAGIGISCGGPLDSKSGVIVSPPNLPDWKNIEIVKEMESKFRRPTFLLNDANACALVEWKLGAGQGTDNMIFLTMGTGMGAGIIANAQLLTGATDLAGEVGHLRLDSSGPTGFGKAGSFEGFCSGGGIARLAAAYAHEKKQEGHVVSFSEPTAKELAELAFSGDTDAQAVWEIVGRRLGQALSILIDTLNPERIVIGSIYARSSELMKATMEEAIEHEAIPTSHAACQVLPAQTGEQLGQYASLMVALYGLGLPLQKGIQESVRAHFEKLFQRYPALTPIRSSVLDAYETIRLAYEGHHKLLICGNGGSASDADHITGELLKGFHLKRKLSGDEKERMDAALADVLKDGSQYLQGALPAISLTNHPALSTAFLNDVHPEMGFAQQVFALGEPGDVLLAISTSGNAKNVGFAARVAHGKGIKVVGLTGPLGGGLKQHCDVWIGAAGGSTAEIQEHHLPIYHTLCSMLESTFFQS